MKCIFREQYVSGDKLGVRCINSEIIKNGVGVIVEEFEKGSPLRITCDLVCQDCKHRKVRLVGLIASLKKK